MKLGLFTNCLSEKSWEDTCRLTGEAGYDGIEPGAGGFPSTSHCLPGEILKDGDLLNDFINTADKHGLEIYGFDVQGNPLHPESSFAEKHTLIYLENISFKWQRAANVGMMFIKTSLLNLAARPFQPKRKL